MGMIGNYAFINDMQLQRLKGLDMTSDETFDIIEEWNDEADHLVDVDKMWDALHFVLTGSDADHPIKGNPLSEAILGEVALAESNEYVAYVSKAKLKEVAAALEEFDMEEALQNFSMEACKEADLYPTIWDYEDMEEEIKEEISDYFAMVKHLYKEAEKLGGNVMITIF